MNQTELKDLAVRAVKEYGYSDGHKIPAIRAFMKLSGEGLVSSKHMIERAAAGEFDNVVTVEDRIIDAHALATKIILDNAGLSDVAGAYLLTLMSQHVTLLVTAFQAQE